MAETAKPLTTATYPAYPDSGGKAALLADLDEQCRMGTPNRDKLWEITQRLSNTTTSGWSDPTATRT